MKATTSFVGMLQFVKWNDIRMFKLLQAAVYPQMPTAELLADCSQ